jgi:hypothetical protein
VHDVFSKKKDLIFKGASQFRAGGTHCRSRANAIHRDDRKISGHAAVLGEVQQGRHEFPPGQVTGSAKNDEHRRFGLVIRFQDPYFFSHFM